MIMSVRVLVRKEKLGNTEKKWKLGGGGKNQMEIHDLKK